MRASRLTLFTGTVSVLGAALVVASLPGLAHTADLLQWLLVSALVLLAGRFTLNIASVEASISVADTFFIAVALLYGPEPATLTLAVDGCLLSLRKHQDWHRVSFNTFAPALSLGLAAHAFFFLSKVTPLAHQSAPIAALLLPLVILTLIYFGLNSGLTAIAVGLESHQPPQQVWSQHLAGLALSYFAAAALALCLVVIVQQVGLLALPIILPIVAEFHLTLRTSFGRLRDAQQHLAEMDHLYLATIETLAMAMDAKDTVTHSHVRRVQALALALADALGITEAPTRRALKTAALLHDTGKLAVPERILNKPGKLTPAEFDEMKRHVDVGADILSLVQFPFPVVPIVRCHHENWDGTGYPRGVAGLEIPIGARILSVADCYDALTSDRPYRGRLTDEAALGIVRERRGTMYDPVVVDALIALDPIARQAVRPGNAQADVLRQLRAAADRPAEESRARSPVITASTAVEAADADRVLPLALLPAGSTLIDVLQQSTRVLAEIVPEATGAWFLVDAADARLQATAPFGPAATLLTGWSIPLGERLTGWVAVHRQLIRNSEAALDLGDAAHDVTPVLVHCLSLPVADGETLAAVLTLYAGERQPFTAAQSDRLQAMAPAVAQAIGRVRRESSARSSGVVTAPPDPSSPPVPDNLIVPEVPLDERVAG